MKTRIISICFAIALLAGIALPVAGCGGPQQAETGKGSLKVGMMTPSTGPAAEKGAAGGAGILDAAKYINEELGGVDGHPLEVVWRDSAYDMSKVITIVKEYKDMGCLLFTTHSSAEMAAAQEIANRDGFPGMATYVSPVNYRPPQHIYAPLPDYADGWIAFAEYYLKNIWKGAGKPKMALHLLANPTGRGAKDGVMAKAEALGIEIITPEEHKTTTISEIESLTRIKAQNPDVLFIASTPAPTAVIIKNAKELGMWPGITIGVGHAGLTSELVTLGGADLVEGVYGDYPMVTWDDDVLGIEKAKEYAQKYNAKYYDTKNVDYLSTWTSTLIVRDILLKALKEVGYEVLSKGDAAAWKAVEEQGIQKLSGTTINGLIPSGISYIAGDNRLSRSFKIFKITNGEIKAITGWQEAPLVKYEEYDWFAKK
jgi:branched-chain amino acid transport system substrate-binding protein